MELRPERLALHLEPMELAQVTILQQDHLVRMDHQE